MQSEILETLRNLDALAEKECGIETVSEIVNRVLTAEGKPQKFSCRFVYGDDEIQTYLSTGPVGSYLSDRRYEPKLGNFREGLRKET